MVTTHTQKGPKMANTYYVVTMTDGTMWRCCAANPESAKAKADRVQAEHGKDRTAVAQIVQDAAQFDAVQAEKLRADLAEIGAYVVVVQ